MAKINILDFTGLFELANGNYGRGSSSELLEVELLADLDFADIEESSEYNEYRESWPGCTGTWYIKFNGNFHTISNISFFSTTASWGFFGTLGRNSTVSNLYLSNINITSSSTAAGIAISAGGTVTLYDCRVSGSITGKVVAGVANLSGSSNVVKNCLFIGNLTTTNGGGFCGIAQNANIINSFFHGVARTEQAAITNGMRLLGGNSMNSFFSGSVATDSAVPEMIVSGGQGHFCYLAVTNIAEIFGTGWTNQSSSSPFTSGSISCVYSTITETNPESHVYGQPKPWSDSEISSYVVQTGPETTETRYVTSPYAEVDLHDKSVFTKRGFEIG